MRFWDSSAIVPLLFDEAATSAVHSLLDEDDVIAVSWHTDVECTSAIARRERERQLPIEAITVASERLAGLAARWQGVAPTNELREAAKRLLRQHALTASDAIQLAAALMLSDDEPPLVAFVALDQRLRRAAAREGFSVLP